jgi:hypothetical protein
MDGIQQAHQTQQLAERLRKARDKAWRAGLSMTSEQAMEQMFLNGSDKKPNPWYRGPEKTDTSSILRDSVNSPLVTLR